MCLYQDEARASARLLVLAITVDIASLPSCVCLLHCGFATLHSFSIRSQRAGSFNRAGRIVIIIVTLSNSFVHIDSCQLRPGALIVQYIPLRFVCKWNARVLPLHRTSRTEEHN